MDNNNLNDISLGDFLQQKRQELGLEIAQISAVLKVKEKIINAIENNEFSNLQDKSIYAYGVIISYAKFLKIEQKLIEEKIKILNFKSNTDNKKHLLLNVKEDKFNPSKEDFYNFSPIAILLFLILLATYSCNTSKGLISGDELITKLQNLHEERAK